jgi:hypothetical protein
LTSDARRSDDQSADRSSPDVKGFPLAGLVITHTDADRFADELDDLATRLSAGDVDGVRVFAAGGERPRGSLLTFDPQTPQ